MIVQIGSTAQYLECLLAETPEEQAAGLVGFRSLPRDPESGYPTGMLFVYDEEKLRSFHMPPEMQLSLDIIFIDASRRITEVFEDCYPGEVDPVTGARPRFEAPAQWVLEVPAHLARQLGALPGVTLHFDDDEEENAGLA